MPEAANPAGAPPAATPAPKKSSRLSRIKTLPGIIGGLLAAIAAVATVLGFAIAVHDGPHAPTKAVWLTHANAVCERDGGNLQSDIGDASTQIEATMTGLAVMQQSGVSAASAGTLANDLSATSAVLLKVGGGFRVTIGDLRGLPEPTQLTSSISHALNQGDKVANNFDQLWSGMLGTLSILNQAIRNPSEMQQVSIALTPQMLKISAILPALSKDLQAWHTASRALGMTECP